MVLFVVGSPAFPQAIAQTYCIIVAENMIPDSTSAMHGQSFRRLYSEELVLIESASCSKLAREVMSLIV